MPPRGKKRWDETVKGSLTDPVYAGSNVYGRHESGDTRVKQPGERVIVEGVREGVVAPYVFKRVGVTTR